MQKITTLVMFAATLAFAGCATGLPTFALPSHEAPKGLGEVVANVKIDAVLDLDAALAIALTHSDILAASCFPALKQFLLDKTGTVQPTPDQIKGVFSAYEKARVERRAIEDQVATNQGLPDYLKLGCAALLQDERLFAARLAALIGGGSIGVPGLSNLVPR